MRVTYMLDQTFFGPDLTLPQVEVIYPTYCASCRFPVSRLVFCLTDETFRTVDSDQTSLAQPRSNYNTKALVQRHFRTDDSSPRIVPRFVPVPCQWM